MLRGFIPVFNNSSTVDSSVAVDWPDSVDAVPPELLEPVPLDLPAPELHGELPQVSLWMLLRSEMSSRPVGSLSVTGFPDEYR